MVDLAGLELHFNDLTALRTDTRLEVPHKLTKNSAYSVVDVRTNDQTFLPTIHAVVDGDDITRLNGTYQQLSPNYTEIGGYAL